jgi:DNA-binding PadR family transcriptional regulator
MSTINLNILGLLMKKPMSPYELAQYIEIRGIRTYIKISTPAIYKNMIKLHKAGYLDSEKRKDGVMPEKTIYKINQKGKNYFLELMEKYSSNPEGIYFDFNSFIAFLGQLNKESGLIMLENLKKKIGEMRDQLIKLNNKDLETKGMPKFPLAGKAIIKQYSIIYDHLIEWLDELKKEYKENQDESIIDAINTKSGDVIL